MCARTRDQGSINMENDCTVSRLNDEHHRIKGTTSPCNTKKPSTKQISNCMRSKSPCHKRYMLNCQNKRSFQSAKSREGPREHTVTDNIKSPSKTYSNYQNMVINKTQVSNIIKVIIRTRVTVTTQSHQQYLYL